MTQPVQVGGAEQLVGEGIAPFTEVQIAGEDGGAALVAFGDEVVEVFVMGWTKRFESEVIDDECQ